MYSLIVEPLNIRLSLLAKSERGRVPRKLIELVVKLLVMKLIVLTVLAGVEVPFTDSIISDVPNIVLAFRS